MRPSLRGIVWFAWGVVALLIAVTVAVGLFDGAERIARQGPTSQPQPAGSPDATPALSAAGATATSPAAVKPPSFDIVSVDRRGQAVIAGRAAPGDRIRVLDGDTPIGEVTADSRGEWVLVPEAPIAPGNRQLGVEATGPDGGAVRRSPDIVALSVASPGPALDERSTLAVLLPGEPGTPARILQRPREPAADRGLSLDAAEYGGREQLVLSGKAAPGARLNIYAGDRLLGSATADEAGKWMLRPAYPHPLGGVELRLDQLAKDGSIVQRIAAPFDPPGRPAIADGDTYVVERGNSLWLIARRAYGTGVRYTAIYDANQDVIRNPHRIYPGQELRLPQP